MRKLKNWLLSYNEYTKWHEAPDSFHLWTGIMVIGSVLRRQVFYDMGYFKLYPNLYVVLVSPTGKSRKTSTAEIGMKMLREIVGINISADLTTREALIKALADSQTASKISAGEIMYHCSLTIYSEELSVFLGRKNQEMISTLTSLYNCAEKWIYKTKGQGSDYISNVWVSMLACTIPEYLGVYLPLDAIGGGFTARVIFVYENTTRRKTYNPKKYFTTETNLLRKDLIHDLNIISKLSGEVVITPEADKFMEDWYNSTEISSVLAEDERFSGYWERKQSHALKIATILTASESDKLVIEKDTFKKALDILEATEETMPKAFGPLGRGAISPDIERVLNQIIQSGEISHSVLLDKNWRHLDSRSFSLVIDTLIDMGAIEKFIVDNKIHYRRILSKKK